MNANFVVSLRTFYTIYAMRYTEEAKDTIWLMGLQGVNYLVPLLVWPYLMVVLGAGAFGVFSFGIALAQYLMLMVDFGFNLTATKQIALAQGNPQETNRLFSATLAAKVFLLILTIPIVLIVSLLPVYAAYRSIVWITWWMVFGNTFSMVWLFQGAGKIRVASIINALVKILILPLTFVFVKSEADVSIAAWIQVSIFMLAALIMILYMRANRLAALTPISRSDVVVQLRGSWSIFLSNAATSIYTVLFVVILAYFVPSDEVGRYAAAEKIMRCLCFLIWIPVSQAYFPRISKLSSSNPVEGEQLVRRLTILLSAALFLAGALLAVFAEPLASLLGKDYSGISHITYVLAIIPMLVGIGGTQGQFGLIALGGEREKKTFSTVYLFAGALALISVCLLSYLWGTIGAAIALVLTEGFVSISMSILNKRRHQHE